VKGGEAAEGTSGVVDAVKNGEGAIGYADASQAGELGKAAIKVGDAFVEPSPEAAAEVFSESKRDAGSGQNIFAYEINRQPAKAGVYPVVLVSYEIACTKYDDADTAALVKGYLTYMVSPEGQQAAQSNAGSAPLSPETDDPGKYVFTYDLERDTTAEGTYPIVLVSYEMACTQYAKAQDAAVVKPFLDYLISDEGQQAAASAAGSAPLSEAIRTKIQPAIDAIGS
jgi:ABC-type phosphate transport system substrate-binding protein